MGRTIERIQGDAILSLKKGEEIDVILKDGAVYHGFLVEIKDSLVKFKTKNKKKFQYNSKLIAEVLICHNA